MAERIDKSRIVLEYVFYLALGAYIEQESKKLDIWRDQSYGQLYNHLKHEIKEIQRSNSLTKQLHNCMDAVMLSLMLLTKVMNKSGLLKGMGE